jgi:hypothetical protein
MPRGDPVHGVGVIRNADAMLGQLVPESYRPGAGDRRRRFQPRQALREFLGPADEWLPDSLAAIGVERREDLAAEAVEDGEPLPLGAGLADSTGDRVQRADATRRQAGRGAQPTGGGNADPQAGEGARTEADREQVDALPATRGRGRPLDLLEQGRRVPGLPLWGETQLRLVQRLAVTPSAGDGVGGSGIEADDNQRNAALSL